MRRAMLAALLVAIIAPAEAKDLKGREFVAYEPQTSRVEMSCFPAPLQSILQDLSKRFGQKVVVTSAARRNGRRNSLHRSCLAADLRIPGVRGDAIAKVARALPGVGGVGTYCGRRRDMVHVDVGPRREWRHC
jgi:uncharacterized protein YcbK (DUF882 family)